MDFEKLNGLIPAIVQDVQTDKVLMLGFMNQEALQKTKKEKKVTFYSRTKERLWTKGEESGNYLRVKKIIKDCDNDTILIKAKPDGPVCHTGTDTCFNEINPGSAHFIYTLQELIMDRKKKNPRDSYTAKLFKKGINKIAQKVGEEAVELIIESKDNNDKLFLDEAADLLYHLMVLLAAKGFTIRDLDEVLAGRHK